MEYLFSEDYFSAETRDGFFVTEAMKRYWAASLKVLSVFDNICSAHDIPWWGDWGTLLGAYRHQGFIPWDDDLDVGMLRPDFQKFISVAYDLLPEGYVLETYDSPGHSYGVTILLNQRNISFDPGFLHTFYNCPFPTGIDIFVYDNCPDDETEYDVWRLEGIKYILPMELIREKGLSHPETIRALQRAGYPGPYTEDERYTLLAGLGKQVDRIASAYSGRGSQKIVSYLTYIKDKKPPYLQARHFVEFTTLPFEGGIMRVPHNIPDVLEGQFGKKYMTPLQLGGDHEYPLYLRDIRNMIGFLKKGGMSLDDLPPMLQYIKTEAMLRIPQEL